MRTEEDRRDLRNLKMEQTLHYILMSFTCLLIIFSVFFAYKIIKKPSKNTVDTPITNNTKGPTKPLPKFIIDKVRPDELEQLKP